MIDSLTSKSEERIKGIKDIVNPEYWTYLEAAAQLCSIHVRWLLKLSKHSFLLKIKSFKVLSQELGKIKYTASLISMGESSYKYMVTGQKNNKIIATGELIIGTRDYTSTTNELRIREHYKGLFKCLMKDMI